MGPFQLELFYDYIFYKIGRGLKKTEQTNKHQNTNTDKASQSTPGYLLKKKNHLFFTVLTALYYISFTESAKEIHLEVVFRKPGKQ